jgi:hypothetical protein
MQISTRSIVMSGTATLTAIALTSGANASS